MRSRNWVNRGIRFLLSMAMVLAFPQYAMAEHENDEPVKMDVAAGYMGTARLGTEVPFKILVKNTGPEITGEIQVEVPVFHDTKDIYAVKVNLPHNSTKTIDISIPIVTATRKIDVMFISNGTVVGSTTYEFKKIFPDNTNVLCVLTSDPDSLRSLRQINTEDMFLGSSYQEADEKIKLMIAAGEMLPGSMVQAETIFPEVGELPETLEMMETFDFIIMNNFDTRTLNSKQVAALEEWVDGGGALVLGTGAGAGYLYAGLPGTLMPFEIQGDAVIQEPEALAEFVLESVGEEGEMLPPAGDLRVALIEAEGAEVILEQDQIPLVLFKRNGSGIVAAMAFNPGLEPVFGWIGQENMWARILFELSSRLYGRATTQQTDISVNTNMLQNSASQVPEEEAPPIGLLFIILGIYLLLVGPVLYIVLKKTDRRDLNWVFIPALSLVFVLIIYIAGFGSRYTMAVANNISIIYINDESSTAEVSTVTALFNNRRNSMLVEYAEDQDVRVDHGNYFYGGFLSSGPSGRMITDGEGVSRKVRSKVFPAGDPKIHEIYGTGMWETVYAYAANSIDIPGGVFEFVSISDGHYIIHLFNNTPFTMEEAFIKAGNNYIEVGDLYPGDRKEIQLSFDDPSIDTRYEDFIFKRYGYDTSGKPPVDIMERNRKSELFNRLFQATGIDGGIIGRQIRVQIHFYALNYDGIGPDIRVNGKETEVYDTNLVYAFSSLEFKPGSRVSIPPGIILPYMDVNTSRTAYLSGGRDPYIYFSGNKGGDAIMAFRTPENVTPDFIKVRWTSFIPLAEKMRMEGGGEQSDVGNENMFFIYNIKSGEWEEFSGEIVIRGAMAGSYISGDGELRVKVSVASDSVEWSQNRLGVPELELKGVAK